MILIFISLPNLLRKKSVKQKIKKMMALCNVRKIAVDTERTFQMNPPVNMLEKSMNCLTTKFMRQSTNKFRCPIFCLAVSIPR